MNLHLIFSSPHQSSALKDCLKCIQEQDGILFLEDGVFATNCLDQYPELKTRECLALESDIKARGLTTICTIPSVTYDEFVELTLKYHKTISWR